MAPGEHAQLKVIEAWIYNLQQITVANGYWDNIDDIADPPKSKENFKQFPAVNLIYGTEARGNRTMRGANEYIHECNFPIIMDFFLKTQPDKVTRDQLRMLWNVQRYFGQSTNYIVPDSEGNKTCLKCSYEEHTKFGLSVNKPNCGIQIIYRIYYRYESDNPSNLA